MEEAFFDTPLYREFAQLPELSRLPDESTILRFRHRLEKYKLTEQILATVNEILTQSGLLVKTGTVVDATLIAAPPQFRMHRAGALKIGWVGQSDVGPNSLGRSAPGHAPPTATPGSNAAAEQH